VLKHLGDFGTGLSGDSRHETSSSGSRRCWVTPRPSCRHDGRSSTGAHRHAYAGLGVAGRRLYMTCTPPGGNARR
jgi:hypothetical protein